MPQTAELPEIFVGVPRPPIEQYEKIVRAVTPGTWLFKGVIWEDGQPPEFGCVVEPARCGEHTETFDTGHMLTWTMEIMSCVEDRRTTQAEGGLPIPGNDVFQVVMVPGLVTIDYDADGDKVRIPVHGVRFNRHEDADFIRQSRDMANELLRYARVLETYSSAKTTEVAQLQQDKALLEAEVARLRGLMLGDD